MTDHDKLNHLAYADAGHTGFAPSPHESEHRAGGGDAIAGALALAAIPDTLTGKDADTVDGHHWEASADHDHAAPGDGGVLTNDEHDGYSEYAEIAKPASPGANSARLYVKDMVGAGVSCVHSLDENGIEYAIPMIPRSLYSGTYTYTHPGVYSGTSSYGGGVKSFTLAQDRIYYEPMIIESTKKLDRILCEVTVGQADKKIRMGIYNADKEWQPTSLVSDCGEVSAAAAAIVAISIDLTLPPGNYLLALTCDGDAVQIRTWCCCLPNFPAQQSLGTAECVQTWYVNHTYGAFHDPGIPWTGFDAQEYDSVFMFIREAAP